MGQLFPAAWIIAIAAMITFHVMADYELRKGRTRRAARLLWPALSLGVSAVLILAFGAGAFLVLAGQAGLLLGIAALRG